MTSAPAQEPTSISTGPERFASLAVFLFLCFAVAGTGAFFPPGEWYASLIRPSFAPPNWLFGPVWTILYLMIAISGWLCWTSPNLISKRLSLFAFAVQLLLNAAWSGIFFGLNQPGWAFVEIVVLWLAILATIVLFKRHSTVAAALLLPYFAWVSFAAVLNYGFWSLN